MVRVLVIWPPHVPSYFNAGHHSGLFMVAGYLRQQPHVAEVVTREAGVLNATWKDIGDLLYQEQFDVIAVMNDFDAIDGLERFLRYARELSPGSRIVTFGRLSGVAPGFFRRFDLDAVVHTGDYESGVAAFVAQAVEDRAPVPLPGVLIRVGSEWLDPSQPGGALDPADWVLPDVDEIPYDEYDLLYANDARKFCGIPLRRELVVPVARGCPIGCSFCEVPDLFGLRERRLDVDRTVDYITTSFERHAFEYVAFYAPTFTLDRAWVLKLCDRLEALPASVRWKCATTIHHLDEELVDRMGRNGCVRISVGLETLEDNAHEGLPRIKRVTEERFAELAGWCSRAGIELNAFVVVGLPGTTANGVHRTVAFARELGARIRPTMYAPLHELTADKEPAEIAAINRQLIVETTGEDPAELYGFVFGHEPRLTEVHERIPQRRPLAPRR